MDWRFVIQSHMRAQEVIVGGKESRQRHGSIERVESRSGFDMVFEGSIQPFNDLLEGSEFSRVIVEVFQSNHLDMLDFVFPAIIEKKQS